MIMYRLVDWGSVTGRCNEGTFSLCHCIQANSGAHHSSYSVGAGGCEGKVAGALS